MNSYADCLANYQFNLKKEKGQFYLKNERMNKKMGEIKKLQNKNHYIVHTT